MTAALQPQSSTAAPTPPAFTTTPTEKSLMAMLSLMEDLSSLYTEELKAIETRDMQRFADIQSAKNRLVSDCEAQMADLHTQASILKMVSPSLKERIMGAEATLRDLAQKSQRECRIRAESAKRVQQRLLEAARHIATRHKSRYDSHGKTNAARVRPDATAINEAI